MNHLPFKWEGPVPLATELRRPLDKMFLHVEHPAWGGASVATLWRTNGTGLTVCSQMQDVAPKREIGVLNFAHGPTPRSDAKAIALGAAFRGYINVLKLVIEESGTTAESGIVLQAGSVELIIVAGAFPFTLAVTGVTTAPLSFDPGYPLDRYVRVPLT